MRVELAAEHAADVYSYSICKCQVRFAQKTRKWDEAAVGSLIES